MFVLQVLEPSRVLSVIHTFDCHTGEVTAVIKVSSIVRPFFTLSHNAPSLLEEALRDDTKNCGAADYVVSYIPVFFRHAQLFTTLRDSTKSCNVRHIVNASVNLRGRP